METILGIDPGTFQTAYTIFNGEKVYGFDKLNNDLFIEFMQKNSNRFELVACEMIKSYGMPIGDSILETCVFIGQIKQTAINLNIPIEFIYRKTIVTHLCGSSKAKDSNVKQALIDRFAKYTSNHGKGTKDNQGFFYGFNSDVWQSFAVSVYKYDRMLSERV